MLVVTVKMIINSDDDDSKDKVITVCENNDLNA